MVAVAQDRATSAQPLVEVVGQGYLALVEPLVLLGQITVLLAARHLTEEIAHLFKVAAVEALAVKTQSQFFLVALPHLGRVEEAQVAEKQTSLRMAAEATVERLATLQEALAGQQVGH